MNKYKIDFFRDFGRKFIHIFLGSVLIFLFYIDFPIIYVFYFLVFCFILALINKKHSLPIVTFFVKSFGKPNEDNLPGKGFLLFLIGFILTRQLFSKEVALASLIVLTYGDSLSHIFAISFPLFKISGVVKYKTILGVFLASLFCSILISSFLEFYFLVSFICSFVSLFIEVFQFKIEDVILDDNILIPLVCGVVILLLQKFLPFLF
jgi:dolichol kinase